MVTSSYSFDKSIEFLQGLIFHERYLDSFEALHMSGRGFFINFIHLFIHSFIYFAFCKSIQGHKEPKGYRTCHTSNAKNT